jgi:hypothetical protein
VPSATTALPPSRMCLIGDARAFAQFPLASGWKGALRRDELVACRINAQEMWPQSVGGESVRWLARSDSWNSIFPFFCFSCVANMWN